MKILIIGGYPLTDRISGSLEHVAKLAQNISAINDMEVHVVSLGNKNEQFKSGNVNVHVVSKMWFVNPFLLPFALWSMKRIAEKINPDVVHALRGFPYFAIALFLRGKYPVLLTVFSLSQRELHFDKSPIWMLKRVFVFIPSERYVIPRIPHIIVQSPFMKSLVTKLTRSKTHIVPEGIEYERLQQFQSLPLLSEPPDIFVAVSFRKLKGMDILIKAIPEVIRSVPNLKVYIAGSGEEELRLKSLVKELGVASHVKFLGFISDEVEKFGYYKACKIVVVPSRWDNEPFAPLDGAVMGKPAIVSDAAHSSVIIDGKTGFVFASENVEELASKIVKLLTDDKLWEEMGKAIREKVKEYDWTKLAKRTVEIYNEVIVDFHRQEAQNR